MRHYSLIFSFFIGLLLLSACRNEPKLPLVEKDTEVSVRVVSDPTGLNYLINYDGTATQIMRQLYLPLLDFNPNTYELEPVLAKSLPVVTEVLSDENVELVTYTYEILDEATWGDGKPITGNDFLFTLKAMYNPNYRSPYPSYFSFVTDVKVDANNPKKFTVYANKYFIANAVIGNFTILPAHQLDPNNIYTNYDLADLKNPKNKEKLASDEQLKAIAAIFTSPKNMGQEGEMNGSGAYKLQDWVAGQSLTLLKKDNWWGDKLNRPALVANPKKIIYKTVPDFNAAISLCRNGELDVVSSIGISDFENLKNDAFFKENYNFYTPKMYAHRTIMMNNADARLEDKNVRKALAHLLDLNEVFEVVYLGEKNTVTSPIHPSKPYYNKDLKPRAFSIEEAKKILASSGWKDSNNNGVLDKRINGELQELNLKLSYSGKFTDYQNIGQIFQEDAKNAGINIELVPLDGKQLQLGWKQKDYDMSFVPLVWTSLHRNLRQRWHSQSPNNYTSFSTLESDAIIDEIANTVDEDKLAELYTRFQKIIYEEQPAIFINTASNHIIAPKKFGKITTSSIAPHFFVNEFSESLVPTNISQN